MIEQMMNYKGETLIAGATSSPTPRMSLELLSPSKTSDPPVPEDFTSPKGQQSEPKPQFDQNGTGFSPQIKYGPNNTQVSVQPTTEPPMTGSESHGVATVFETSPPSIASPADAIYQSHPLTTNGHSAMDAFSQDITLNGAHYQPINQPPTPNQAIISPMNHHLSCNERPELINSGMGGKPTYSNDINSFEQEPSNTPYCQFQFNNNNAVPQLPSTGQQHLWYSSPHSPAVVHPYNPGQVQHSPATLANDGPMFNGGVQTAIAGGRKSLEFQPPCLMGPSSNLVRVNQAMSMGTSEQVSPVVLVEQDTSTTTSTMSQVVDHLLLSDDDKQSTANSQEDGEMELPCNDSGLFVCYGCGGTIQEKIFVKIGELAWHEKCACCEKCGFCLNGESSCYFKENKIYCKQDYLSLFHNATCYACNNVIFPNERLYKCLNGIFHDNGRCLSCISCNKVLAQGDFYKMYGIKIVCQDCSIQTDKSINENGGCLVGSNCIAQKRSVPLLYHGVHATYPGVAAHSQSDESLRRIGPVKTKRNRTSFKPEQLRCMKEYFQSNKNPDSKDLKQLAADTGLTKRVLQVWFQNQRAKHRRTVLGGQQTRQSQNGSQSHESNHGNGKGHLINPLPGNSQTAYPIGSQGQTWTVAQQYNCQYNNMAKSSSPGSNYSDFENFSNFDDMIMQQSNSSSALNFSPQESLPFHPSADGHDVNGDFNANH